MRATKSPVVQPPPTWVIDLVDRACVFLGTEQRPSVVWQSRRKGLPPELNSYRHRYRVATEGKTHNANALTAGWVEFDPPRVVVFHGTLRYSQRMTLLHELAHWWIATTYSAVEYHTARFWDAAWRLYQKFMPHSLSLCLELESRYMTGALRSAVRAGIVDPLTAAENPHLRRDVPLLEPLKGNK